MPVLLGSYAAGYLVPGPAEELFHAASLTRFGFRPRDLVSMHLVDKALGVMSVALVALPVVRGVSRVPLLLGIAVALVLGGAGVLLSRARGSISVAALARALACLVVSNLASVAIVHLSLAAVGTPSSLGADLEIFAATACACVLPLTPGQVGVVEAAFAATAAHRGVPPSAALTAAILYHGAHVVPLIVAGLPSMIRVLVANRDAGKPQAARGPETCALPS